MINQSHIIFLSSGGFPFKISAVTQKFKLIAKALLLTNYHTTLLTKLNLFANVDTCKGQLDGINYIYLSGKKKRKGIIDKIIGLIKGYLNEFFFIIKLRKKSNKNYLILSYCSFPILIYYYILSRLAGHKLVISIMEYHPSIAKGQLAKFNSYLFDYYSFFFSDGAIPISHKLNEIIKNKFNKLPTVIIPPLADYNEFDKYQESEYKPVNNYFLFCGSTGYYDIIDFIIRAFNLLDRKQLGLKLVLSGKQQDINNIEQTIKPFKNINIYSHLTYEELYKLYANATGLLIPLRPVPQDEARFPQKIAEYLASGTPIITNNYGEIPYFFEDGINAFVAKKFDTEMYVEKFNFVIDNPAKAIEVGLNGQKLGRKKFHYENYTAVLKEYLENI